MNHGAVASSVSRSGWRENENPLRNRLGLPSALIKRNIELKGDVDVDIDMNQTIVDLAIEYDKPVRIGVNWGSLDARLLARLMDENASLSKPLDASVVMREALISSAVDSAMQAEQLGLPHDRIILSCKVSDI